MKTIQKLKFDMFQDCTVEYICYHWIIKNSVKKTQKEQTIRKTKNRLLTIEHKLGLPEGRGVGQKGDGD